MIDEFKIINKYFLPLTNNKKEANFLQDDVATIHINSNNKLVVSKDMMVEDVHFVRSEGAYNIASRLLRTNLSDIASSGAKPLYYLLGFSKNKNVDESFIQEFSKGLQDAQEQYKVFLIGGDTVNISDKLCFSITVFGEIKKNKQLKRSGAKDGDLIFVSGNIGDAFLGRKILQNKIKCSNKKYQDYLVNRHLRPTPRVNLGKSLLKHNLSKSAIDVSDGLLSDINHICQSSKFDATIYQDKIPISNAAKICLKENSNISFEDLISGGDDYELIFSANVKHKDKILALSKKIDIKVTHLGYFMQNSNEDYQVKLINSNMELVKIKKYGYLH